MSKERRKGKRRRRRRPLPPPPPPPPPPVLLTAVDCVGCVLCALVAPSVPGWRNKYGWPPKCFETVTWLKKKCFENYFAKKRGKVTVV